MKKFLTTIAVFLMALIVLTSCGNDTKDPDDTTEKDIYVVAQDETDKEYGLYFNDFGDGENDIPMLESVGIGIAMGNASKHVKDCAKYVTLPVDEDGIAFALKYLSLSL